MPYGFYLTDKGKELIAASLDGGEKVTISKACFGSGGDPSAEEFDGSITDLEEQFYEKELDPQTDSVKPLESNLSQLEIITEVPPSVEGTISEIGYKDQNDNLILYGLIQRQVKESAANVSFLYDNFIYFENGENEQIEFLLLSPEYTRVEELVQETNTLVEQVRSDFDIEAYQKRLDDFEDQLAALSGGSGLSDLTNRLEALEQRVSTLETTVGSNVERLEAIL